MAETHTYTTTLKWKETRRGESHPPGLPPLEVATPPEFPGGIGGVWSPEHLFVAAVEACIMTTFLAIAANSKLEFESYESRAVGTLETTDSGMRITEVVVSVHVVVADESRIDRARRILEKAEQHCLISNSVNSKVVLEPDVSAQ